MIGDEDEDDPFDAARLACELLEMRAQLATAEQEAEWLSEINVELASRLSAANAVVLAAREVVDKIGWVADLLGYVEGDELVDFFPGTGVMGRTLAQGRLSV